MLQERTPEAPAWRFGVFEVDLAAGELRKRGIRIKLQEQPYRVLALLLGHPGEVVSREVIRKTLWPNDTFVEFEQSISAAVAKLRVALGDSAENPRFIETVARHGYRFIAPVSRTAESRPVPSPIRNLFTKPEQVRYRGWLLAGTLIMLAAATGLAVFTWKTRTARQAVETEFRPTPLTSNPGTEAGPSLSPDGTRVAFYWDGLIRITWIFM